jgi:hypothetical protein
VRLGAPNLHVVLFSNMSWRCREKWGWSYDLLQLALAFAFESMSSTTRMASFRLRSTADMASLLHPPFRRLFSISARARRFSVTMWYIPGGVELSSGDGSSSEGGYKSTSPCHLGMSSIRAILSDSYLALHASVSVRTQMCGVTWAGPYD